MTTKFTPGPWFRNIRANGKYPTIFAGRNQHVATACQQTDPAETEANIDLIAAAPETAAECERLRATNAQLRVSLEWAIGHIDGSPSLSHKACLTAIRAVVDRAKGEAS